MAPTYCTCIYDCIHNENCMKRIDEDACLLTCACCKTESRTSKVGEKAAFALREMDNNGSTLAFGGPICEGCLENRTEHLEFSGRPAPGHVRLSKVYMPKCDHCHELDRNVIVLLCCLKRTNVPMHALSDPLFDSIKPKPTR